MGTKVCVEDLFFNTPARLKYMKSQQAELSHIIDIVNRLGLAHPEISFSLISDGKEMTRTAGTGPTGDKQSQGFTVWRVQRR